MDARRDQDAPVLQAGETRGRIHAEAAATRRQDRDAPFAAYAIDWQEVPRAAYSGWEGELADRLSCRC